MRAYLSSNWSYGGGNINAITFNQISYDTNNFYNTTTGKFQPTIPGYYLVIGKLYFNGGSSTHDTRILKNGTTFSYAVACAFYNDTLSSVGSVSDIVYLNGTTDYIQIGTFGSLATTIIAGSDVSTFTCMLTS